MLLVLTDTQTFRRQHGELMTLARQIQSRLEVSAIHADPRGLRILVARFAGLLRVHERMETEALYPILLEHPNEEVRGTARRLLGELGPLYSLFDAYEKEWPSADALAERPDAFIRATQRLFAALGRRMAIENQELYPLVEPRAG